MVYVARKLRVIGERWTFAERLSIVWLWYVVVGPSATDSGNR